MNNLRLLLVTFPTPEAARQIGTVLVEKQLAACVNLIPAVESIYRWQGQLESATETLAIIKTTAETLTSLETELHALHPYDVPECISIAPDHVSAPYLAWACGNVRPG